MRKIFFTLCTCCAVMALTVCSCDNSDDKNVESEKVALILPNGEMVTRWGDDLKYLQKSLKSYGYDVHSFLASENEAGAKKQVEQIKQAINAGYRNIVITPIDYKKINEDGVLEANQNCNIICYDRMIMDNDAIDFYTTCDPSKIGEMQAQYLLSKIGSEKMTIEYFAGPKTDKNAATYFESAYKMLGNSELLSVPSGKKTYDEVALKEWSSADAYDAMTARLKDTETIPDLILAPNDNVANGVIMAIEQSDLFDGTYPIITGQDMELQAKENIKKGKQAMTINKEYQDLAETTAMIVSCLISGKSVTTSQQFDNGKILVPAKYTNFTLITSYNVDKY